MHTLHEKRGKKKVTHYFHHVTEKDGTKKHVYLGADEERAKERLTKLRVARIRSENRLIKELDEVQRDLQKLGEYNKSYEQLEDELMMNHLRERHAERLLGEAAKPFPTARYVMIFAAIMVLTAFLYHTFSDTTITGAAIRGVKGAAESQFIQVCFFLLVGLVVIVGVFRLSDYAMKRKYEKYRPPETD
jgi:hypothetical protein